MKKIITLGLLLISSLTYSQSIQIIKDDKFTFKSNNQSFVVFKIRVIDEVGYHSDEQIGSGQYAPRFRIIKFDNVFTKKWDTPISSRHNIEEIIKDGVWTKKGNNTVYEWLYLLETNPKKSGYYFETLSLIIEGNEINIPILRKIATENNRLYNYGTIEITINQSDRKPSYKLLNDDIEKQNIINNVKVSDPNIYNAYKDKISDEDLKFFFTITTVGELNLKSSYDYWSKLYGDGIDGQTGYGITINSKKNGQSQQTQMSFNEIIDLPVNFDITYTSEWKKGDPDRPYGLIIGNSANNKYFFYNTTNGKSGIEGTSNGTNEISEISNQNTFSSDKLNKKNNYKIEIRNNKATYYINNIKVGAFDLNTDLSKAFFVGFMVKDKQKVYFDKLQIIEQ
jgi:hypothetical protein